MDKLLTKTNITGALLLGLVILGFFLVPTLTSNAIDESVLAARDEWIELNAERLAKDKEISVAEQELSALKSKRDELFSKEEDKRKYVESQGYSVGSGSTVTSF